MDQVAILALRTLVYRGSGKFSFIWLHSLTTTSSQDYWPDTVCFRYYPKQDQIHVLTYHRTEQLQVLKTFIRKYLLAKVIDLRSEEQAVC